MPANQPIDVLVVDDSLLYRRVLTGALKEDPGIGSVRTAKSGEEALRQLKIQRPDAVVLDVVMPGMDGLQVLRAIRQTDPRLPVVMFSTETSTSAKPTIEALTLGASDCVLKPKASQRDDVIRQRLLPRLKVLARSAARRAAAPATARERKPIVTPKPRPSRTAPVRLVAIGSSTGGPAALEKLLKALPGDFPVPIVIVQHMPPTFTKYLAQQLDSVCALTIREATDGVKIAPGEAWIAPGGRHMTVARGGAFGRLFLNDAPPVNACRPAVDVLFQSAADTFGRGVLAAVLTGMGTDGAKGAVAIQDAGGQTLAQDEASSVVWGMPRAVFEAGAARMVLPLDQIAPTLFQIATATRNRIAS